MLVKNKRYDHPTLSTDGMRIREAREIAIKA